MWFFLILIGLITSLYIWLTWNHDYWKKLGIPYSEPSILFGNMIELILARRNTASFYGEIYNKFQNEPAVGIFKMRQPQLVLRDMDLIKAVVVKEFNNFHDNDFVLDKSVDPILARNPFFSKGEEWKAVRSLHSKNQSTGKVKDMFPMMEEVVEGMKEYISDNCGREIDGKYFCGQYTADVVGSCVFGLKINSFKDPDGEFRKNSVKIFLPGTLATFAIVLLSTVPSVVRFFKIRRVPKDATGFFMKIVEDMCNYRKKNNVRRDDFLQILLDENEKCTNISYTPVEITAHAMTFFFDGYETSSITMSHALYMMALHPETQDKLRNEINNVGELGYEEIHSMKYLLAVINETLRMYPPAPAIFRQCNKDTTLLSGTKAYPIKKGVTVLIPMRSIQMDPELFPEPEKFNPERFYEKPPSPNFFPFGLGPRACPGARFAMTQIKIGVASIIKNFRVFPRDTNATMPEINEKSPFLLVPKQKLWLKFEKIS